MKKICVILLSVICCLSLGACFIFGGGKDKPKAESNVFLVDKEITVYVGETYEFRPTGAESFNYTSSDEKIAKVTSNGLLTGVSDGNAFINVSAGDKSVTCKVNVIKTDNYIRLNTAGVTVAAGSDVTIRAEVISGGKTSYDKVVFDKGTASNVTLKENGINSVIVSVEKTGNYVVTATYGDLKAECVIKAVNLNAETLAKPEISVENCKTVKWNAVANASAYTYSVNGGEWVKTANTSFDAASVTDALKYKDKAIFAVKAMSGENDFNYIDGLPASIEFSHEYEITVIEEYDCAKAGKVSLKCSVCDKEYTDNEFLADHNFVDGTCTVCGLPQTKKVVYRYDESNDCYFVVGADAGYDSEDLYILAKYDDGEHGERKVKYIGYGAFASNTTIKRVYLPDSMTEFADKDDKFNKMKKNGTLVTSPLRGAVFDGCSNLEFISMKGITMLCAVADPAYAHWNFRDCYNLKQVIVGDKFNNYGATFMRWAHTPDNAENQTDIYVYGDSVTRLEDESYPIAKDVGFGNNTLLTGDVFRYDENSDTCYTWHYAEDGKTVVSGGKHVFNNKNRCKKCGTMNGYGVSYDYNAKKGVYYVSGYNGSDTTVNVSDVWNDGEHGEHPVKYVGFEAFRGNLTVTRIILPASVDSLEGGAFWSCTNLEYVSMPGVKNLDYAGSPYVADSKRNNNFRNCNKLKYVVVGTEFSSNCGQFNTENLETAVKFDFYVDGKKGAIKLEADNTLWTGSIWYKGEPDMCFTWNEDDGVIERGPDKHDFVDGVCTVCGAKDVMGVTYAFNKAKNVYYVASCKGTNAKVVVFETWNDGEHGDHPVKYVDYKAFENNTNVKKVVLPESVDSLEGSVFLGCDNLEFVSMPGVKTMDWASRYNGENGDNNFYGCTKLKYVVTGTSLSSNCQQFLASSVSAPVLDFYVKGESGAPALTGNNNLWTGKVYYYSETKKADCWHYDENGDIALWK